MELSWNIISAVGLDSLMTKDKTFKKYIFAIGRIINYK